MQIFVCENQAKTQSHLNLRLEYIFCLMMKQQKRKEKFDLSLSFLLKYIANNHEPNKPNIRENSFESHKCLATRFQLKRAHIYRLLYKSIHIIIPIENILSGQKKKYEKSLRKTISVVLFRDANFKRIKPLSNTFVDCNSICVFSIHLTKCFECIISISFFSL